MIFFSKKVSFFAISCTKFINLDATGMDDLWADPFADALWHVTDFHSRPDRNWFEFSFSVLINKGPDHLLTLGHYKAYDLYHPKIDWKKIFCNPIIKIKSTFVDYRLIIEAYDQPINSKFLGLIADCQMFKLVDWFSEFCSNFYLLRSFC